MGITATVIVIATFLANISIFLAVNRNNSKSWTNRLLSLLAVIFALWTVTNFFALQPASEEQRLFWVRVVMVVTAPMGITTYLLANVFPQDKLTIKKLYLYTSLALVVGSILLTPFMFTNLTNLPDGGFSLTPGPGIALFAVNHLGLTTLGLFVLIRKYRKSEGILRRQYNLFLTGLILTLFLITATNFVAVVFFKTIQYTFIGPTMTLFLVGFVSYAVLRHRFLDMSPLLARTVSYTLLLFTVVFILSGALYTLPLILPFEINDRILFFALTFIVAFFFNPIRNSLEKLTDNIFFKGHYNTEELLSDLTHTMAQEINLKELTNDLLVKLLRQMRLTSGAFLVISNGKLDDVFVKELNESDLHSLELIKLAQDSKEMYVFEEFSEKEQDLKDLFRDLNIRVALPLRVKRETVGLLVLGPKSSGDIYSSQDIELLTIFAPQAAVAMKNAQSYRQIQEFSKTLEKKVEERTKELKETQKRELSKAKELLKLKDEFVFIATHDLRTPVTAISGFIELIREQADNLPKNINEDFDAIQEASARLNQLVDDLLEVARSESGTIKIEPKPVDFVKVSEASIKQVTPSADERGIKIKTNYDSTYKLVMADEEKLFEIMENLLSNAVKYNKDRGSINVRTKKSDNMLMIEVMDTGFGIPKDKHNKVFQKFFRAQQEGTEGIPGTGLGLFVVRMLIEKMKGKISFESTEGEGTTFVFTLPLAK